MLLTPGQTEERVWHYVRGSRTLHATAADIARTTHHDVGDVRHVLDELVARNVIRRFDAAGESPIYWN
jgi:hypothetical protein